METTAQKLIGRYTYAKDRRRMFDIMWQDVSDYVLPYRGGFTRQYVDGETLYERVYDPTAIDALEVAASGIYTNAVNPSSRWLQLKIQNTELMNQKEIKEWLNTCSEIIQSSIDVNLAMAMIENFKDWLGYGMCALFIQEEDSLAVPYSGTAYPLNSIYCDVDYRNKINTVFRVFDLSYAQAEEQFGSKLPKDLRSKYSNDPNNAQCKLKFLHCIERKRNRNTSGKTSSDMPWASYYISLDTKEIIDQGGFQENPYIIPRFSVMPGEIYGRGPMLKALPTVKSLNLKVKNQLDASNMAIRPPMDVPEEAYITPLRLLPGAKNMNQDPSGRKATPINVVGDLNITYNDIQEDRQNIRTMMYNDLLKLPLQNRMTTLEVDWRKQDQLAMLGPFFVRLEQEYFDALVERVAGIYFRNALLPEVPVSLPEGTELIISYDSPLARALKSSNVRAIDNTLSYIGSIVQLYPEILDNYDFDAMSRARSEDSGFPLAYMRSEEDVAKLREERQQAAQQAEQGQQAVSSMDQASKLAQAVNTVGNTPGMEGVTQQLAQALQQNMTENEEQDQEETDE